MSDSQEKKSRLTLCMICCQRTQGLEDDLNSDLIVYPQFQTPTELNELFQVFCEWMSWKNEKENYRFDFQDEDFPFCNPCKSLLVECYRLNEMVAGLKKQIEQITGRAAGRILLSERIRTAISADEKYTGRMYSGFHWKNVCPIQKDVGDGKEYYMKLKFYRHITLKQFLPKVEVRERKKKLLDKEDLNSPKTKLDEPITSVEAPVDHEIPEMVIPDSPLEFIPEGPAINEDIGEPTCTVSENKSASLIPPAVVRGSVGFSESLKLEQKEESEPPAVIRPSKQLKVVYQGKFYPFFFNGSTYKCGLCKLGSADRTQIVKHIAGQHFRKQKSKGSPVTPAKVGDTITKKLPAVKYPKGFSYSFQRRVEPVANFPSKFLFVKLYPFEKTGENSWSCTNCGASNLSVIQLEVHLKKGYCKVNPEADNSEYTEKFLFGEYYALYSAISDRWKCKLCYRLYHSREMLSRHILTTCPGNSNRLVDTACVETQPNKFTYGEFSFQFENGQYQCGSCTHTAKARWSIMLHIERIHGETAVTNYMIEVRPNYFLYADKYEVEKEGEEFRCCTCSFKTATKRLMTQHLCNQHLNDRQCVCELCGRGYHSNSQLRDHQRKKHNGECELVPWTKPRTADPEPINYVCEKCGKVCVTRYLFKYHMDEHMDKREVGVQCPICNKYIYKHNYYIHKKVHRLRHFCPECSLGFETKTSLRIHRRTHEGLKVYTCDICNHQVSWPASLRKHKRTFHRESNEGTAASYKIVSSNAGPDGVQEVSIIFTSSHKTE